VRDARAELVQIRRERDREIAASKCITVARQLLEHARAYLALPVDRMTPEQCELTIRCAEALTSHAREQRIADRQQLDPQPTRAGEPRITHVSFEDSRLTD